MAFGLQKLRRYSVSFQFKTNHNIEFLVVIFFFKRSIEDTSRKHLQHHQMFGNTRITFHLVLEDLNKSDKSLDVRNPTEWLLQKSREQKTSQESEDFETLATLSQQVRRGGDSSNFACDQYSHYLRCLHRVAEKNGAVKSAKQIEFFYLLPFNYPTLPDPREKGNETLEKIRTTKKEWDKTLYNWMHKKGDEDFGKSMKEDAKRFLSALRNATLNCHKL